MTEELFEKAQDYMGEIKSANWNLESLREFDPENSMCSLTLGTSQGNSRKIYLETEISKQVIRLVIDYYEKNKAQYQQQFKEL